MIFWRRKTHETELDEELRTHLSMAAQTRMERAVDPEESERAGDRGFHVDSRFTPRPIPGLGAASVYFVPCPRRLRLDRSHAGQ